MLTTTRDWKVALGCYKVPNRDRLNPPNDIKIEYEQVDATAQNSASVTVSGHTSFSDESEVMNLSLDFSSYKGVATLEPNEWALDGEMEFIGSEGHCGWVSDVMSGADGSFASHPKLTLTWTEEQTITIPGLSIWWSQMLGEWASEFTITAKKNGNTVFTQTYYGDSYNGFYEGAISGYDTVEIDIAKWCLPYRRARIENVCMGFTVYISKSEVLTAEHSMSSDLLSFTLPDDYFTFEIDNVSEEWNPDNPTGRYAYLLERQRVTVKYAFKINGAYEWHTVGTYFMSEWTTPQNGISASFTARSLIDFMTKKFVPSNITGYTYGDTISLKELADEAFTQAGLPLDADGSEKWEIADELDDIDVVIPYSGEDSGYTRLDYIQFSGTQRIDTGLLSTQVDKIKTKINPSQVTNDMHIVCGTRSGASNAYRIYCAINEGQWYCDWKDTSHPNIGAVSVNTDYEIEGYIGNNSQYLKVNGATLVTGIVAMHNTSVENYIGVWSSIDGVGGSEYHGKIYYVKLYKNNNLVRDFIPCKRNSDGAIGLYDLVGETFYGNSGSGAFTYGAEQGTIIKNPKYDFDYTCAEVIQLCANAGCAVIRPNENGDICIKMPSQIVSDYYIDQFVAYSNGEYELSKALKTVNINDGELIYTPSGSVDSGEEQAISNCLLQDTTQRTAECAWVSDLLLKRKSIDGEFRADVRLQPLDVITCVNKYARNRVYVDSVRWTYSGAFKGSYTARVLMSFPLVDDNGLWYSGEIYSGGQWG